MGFRLGVIGFHAKSSTRDISQQNSQPCKLILHAEKLLPEMRSEARTASPHCRHYCARLHWIFPPPPKHGFLIISQKQALFQCLSSFDKMLHKCDQLTNCKLMSTVEVVQAGLVETELLTQGFSTSRVMFARQSAAAATRLEGYLRKVSISTSTSSVRYCNNVPTPS